MYAAKQEELDSSLFELFEKLGSDGYGPSKTESSSVSSVSSFFTMHS
jgi:hypothetical protein